MKDYEVKLKNLKYNCSIKVIYGLLKSGMANSDCCRCTGGAHSSPDLPGPAWLSKTETGIGGKYMLKGELTEKTN